MKHREIASPVGPLTLVVDRDGVLAALHQAAATDLPPTQDLGERDDTIAADAVRQLEEYFTGERSTFDLKLAPRGTEFQRRVWDALREVPYGMTSTYGAVALRMGVPRSARAVGAATGRNPIGIIVPCHRVIGANGVLTGYAAGLARKQFLLDHEGAALPGVATVRDERRGPRRRVSLAEPVDVPPTVVENRLAQRLESPNPPSAHP